MRRLGFLSLAIAMIAAPVMARHDTAGCGTTATPAEVLFLHRQAERARAARFRPRGSPVVAFGDDDSHTFTLPFAFPFYGASYSQVLSRTTLQPAVYIGSTPVSPIFSGLAPGFVGLYQVDVQIPAGLVSGTLPLEITSGTAYRNTVNIAVQ